MRNQKTLVRPLVAIGVVFAASMIRSNISTVGPLIPQIKADLALSSGAAGMLTTIPLILFALFSPLAGSFLPRFRTTSIVLVCLVSIVIGSLVRSYLGLPGLYLGTLGLGFGIGVLNVLLPVLIRGQFAGAVGPMMGTYNLSMNITAGLGSGISALLALHIGGWRNAMAIWCLFALVGIPIWLILRRNSSFYDGPFANGSQTVSWRQRLNRNAIMAAAFMGLQAFIYFCYLAWTPSLLESKVSGTQMTGNLMLLFQGVSLVPGFVVPVLTERMKSRAPIVIVGSLGYCCGLGLLLFGSTLPQLILGCALCGVGSGTSFSFILTIISLSGSDNTETTWMSGFVQMVGYAIAAVGPFLLGTLFDASQSWTPPILLLMSLCLVMLLIGVFAGRTVNSDGGG